MVSGPYWAQQLSQRLGYAVTANEPASTLLVVTKSEGVTKSQGDTYLVAVAPTMEPDDPAYQHHPETILTGFEGLPATNA